MFTRQEIDVLIDALRKWEQSDFVGDFVESFMLDKVPPEKRAEFERDLAQKKAKREIETRTRRERSIMLQAKLLSLRDSEEAGNLLAESASVRQPSAIAAAASLLSQ